MEDPIGFLEILRSSPQTALIFSGMAAGIALLFYLLLKKDIRHIEKLLTNHITETNGKIEDLKGEVRENRKELKAEIQANEGRAEAWRKEQKAEARENEARAEAWRKEQKSDAKENVARLEKKLDKILEKRD